MKIYRKDIEKLAETVKNCYEYKFPVYIDFNSYYGYSIYGINEKKVPTSFLGISENERFTSRELWLILRALLDVKRFNK